MKKKLLIVQPHSDDALFSCAHPILSDEYEVQVLTIENNPKRIAEDQALYDFLGVKLNHLNVEFQDESYYEYFQRFRTITHTDAMGYLAEYFSVGTLKLIKESLRLFLNHFTTKNPSYKIVAPLGISHPFHYFIHDLLKDKADYFYREFPHSYKKRSKTQMEETLLSFELHETFPVKEIHDIKKCLPEEIYVKKKS